MKADAKKIMLIAGVAVLSVAVINRTSLKSYMAY